MRVFATAVRDWKPGLAGILVGLIFLAACAGPRVAPPEAAATDLPAPATATQPAAVASQPSCSVTTDGLRLRSGPGTVYNPPLAGLPAGTNLRPLAYSPSGYPDGQWMVVQVLPAGQIGWVIAGPASVACNLDPATLPAGAAPPTPAAAQPVKPSPPANPVPTPTPPRLTARPPDGEVQVEILDPQDGDAISGQLIFEAQAVRIGLNSNKNGTGIDHVDMFILDANGKPVYNHTETTARYCAFGGGEPICNVWIFASHGQKWPNGRAIKPGAYTLRAVAYSVFPDFDRPATAEISVTVNP